MRASKYDEAKIKLYAKIQKSLCDLYKNPSNEGINNLINQIPSKILDHKDDLMVICELFALFGRFFPIKNKKNVFKLFNKIMKPIKKHLRDESSFFWKIFGGNYYFKLWFYQEGLISIETVVSFASDDDTGTITEIFLPEIIEKVPEIFEKELKYKYKCPYSDEYIEEYKKRRSLHLTWIKESGDYNHQIYSEIENDKFRLCIKRDDIETFKKYISEENYDINMSIMQESFENEYLNPSEYCLLDFSITSQAQKILKYLIKKNAKISDSTAICALSTHNDELVKIVKYKALNQFVNIGIDLSLLTWSYINFFEHASNNISLAASIEDLDDNQAKEIINLIEKCFKSSNFIFFESVILPFLKKNPSFVEKYIYNILFESFGQMSCFFTQEFLKFKDIIDINHREQYKDGVSYSILAIPIFKENMKGIKIILSYPNLRINQPSFKTCPAFIIACKKKIDLKTIDLFCNYPGFDINAADKNSGFHAFDLACGFGNFYTTEYILKRYSNIKIDSLVSVLYTSISHNHFYTAKITLKYFLERDKDLNPLNIIKEMKKAFHGEENYKKENINTTLKIISELGYNFPVLPEEDSDYSDDSEDMVLAALLLGLLMRQ